MPVLHWDTKSTPQPAPASLQLEAYIYPGGAGYPERVVDNRLVLGDNLEVMSALLPEWEGRIQLIYADPPFFTNRAYRARVGHGEDSRKPSEWQLAEGYPDSWSSIDEYLEMLYPRLHLMHRLLALNGTLYLHLDWHADAYARLLLDEIFGPERLLNEIIWAYHGPSPIRSAFNRKHDTILAYTKSKDYVFNADDVRQPYDPSTVKTFAASPKAGFGKIPDLERGKVPEDWWYFPVVARLHHERTGYPTQKPEALLERIIRASSHPGNVVADFFCGSGTTPLVANRLGRSFIAADVTTRAIRTTCARLVQANSAPFAILRVARAAGQPPDQDPGLNESLVLRSHPSTPGTNIIRVNADLLAGLVYWEVDPAWDGKIFRSVVQAARSHRSGELAGELNLPCVPGDRPVCVRLVDTLGEISSFSLPVDP